jgi:hypothetical protein
VRRGDVACAGACDPQSRDIYAATDAGSAAHRDGAASFYTGSLPGAANRRLA